MRLFLREDGSTEIFIYMVQQIAARHFSFSRYKTRVIPNNVCIVISTQFNLNCIFRIDLIHLQQKSLQEYVNTITCTRILNLNSVRKIFECFVNPACGNFSWSEIETTEFVLLNDFRWKPSLIPWCQFLQVLEGDTVHFRMPKTKMSKDIVLEKDTSFFATSDALLVFNNNGCLIASTQT